MSRTLKPLVRQAAVLTGAASGIGLAATCAAADRSDDILLAARDEPPERAAPYGRIRRSSLYARAQLSPRATALVLIGLSAALVLLNAVRAWRRAPLIRAAALIRERRRANWPKTAARKGT